MIMGVWVAEFPKRGWPDGRVEGWRRGCRREGQLVTSSPLHGPFRVCSSHLQHLMIFDRPHPAYHPGLCVCQTNGLSPGPPISHPRAQRLPSLWSNLGRHHYQIGSQQPLRDPFSAIVLGTNGLSSAPPLRPSPGCLPALWEGEGMPTELFWEAFLLL